MKVCVSVVLIGQSKLLVVKIVVGHGNAIEEVDCCIPQIVFEEKREVKENLII